MLNKRNYKFPGEQNQDFRVLSKDIERAIKNKVCIDLGCGDGLYTKELAKHASMTVALDINLENLRLLKKMNLNSTYFVVADIASLPFKNERFDFAICIEVITHMSYFGMQRTFSEISRILKPGSNAIITMHNWRRFVFYSLKHLRFPSISYRTCGLEIWPIKTSFLRAQLSRYNFKLQSKIRYLNFFNDFSWDMYSNKKMKSFFYILIEDILTIVPFLNTLAITYGVTLIRK